MSEIDLATASEQRLQVLAEQRRALHILREAIASRKSRSICFKAQARLLRLQNALLVPAEDAGR